MRLIEVYAEEFGEVYERVSGLLLDLESAAPGPDRAALVEQLQRALHGAKGGALVIPELKEVAGFVHAAEDYLAAVPTEGSLAAGLFDPVFRGLDGAREVVDAILHETPPPGLQAFIAALSPQVAEAIAPASDAEAEPAAPAPVSVAAPPPAAEGPPASDADGGGSEAGDPEEAAEAGSAPGTTVGKPAGGDTVRVAVAELDVLIRSLGGLATSREGVARVSQTLDAISTALGLALRAEAPDTAALTELHGQLDTLSREARQVQHQLVRSSRAVQDAALRLRMQPFSAAFPFVRRAARDVQRRTGRDARLVLEGGDVLIDKRALDALRPSLLHLIRNALDHGIETPAARRAAGKAPKGILRVALSRRGDRILLIVEDDGRGVDEEALRRRAEQAGVPDAATAPIVELMTLTGLSSRERATEVSGRGVGLDSVRRTVEDLGGRFEVASEQGEGTRFGLSLPPVLATRKGLLVRAADQRLFVPLPVVQRLMRLERDQVVSVDGRDTVDIGGSTIRVVELGAALGYGGRGPQRRGGQRTVVVVVAGAETLGLEVDEVLDQAEIVVQPLRYPVHHLPGIEGAAIGSDGEPVPVLEVSELSGAGATVVEARTGAAEQRPPRVLIVDDSITTRSLEQNVLEGAGMTVVAASDGVEGLDLLRAATEPFDIVISDVEMPRLDGLGFLREVRATYPKEELPLILVTSLDRDEVRREGLESGANAFIVKQTFDPEHLLSVIHALIPEVLT